MANTEEPEGHKSGKPPAAWVWSQYRAETSAAPQSAPEAGPAVETAAAPGLTKRSSMIGLGLAAAVLVVAGLTWLFTTRHASGPTEPSELPKPAAVEEPAAPGKAESISPAPAPAPAAAVTQEAPRAAEPPAPEPARKKKGKRKRGEN